MKFALTTEGSDRMVTWKKIAEKLTNEFMDWGCRFSPKQLPEIAMTYDCTPLFFWNWQDGEVERSEKGFLRVLGYAWKKVFEEESDPESLPHPSILDQLSADEQINARQIAA